MDILKGLITEYGMDIIFFVLTTVASYIGLKVKKVWEKYINDKVKKEVVESAVNAVEQLYKNLKGEEKLNKAKENIIALLNEKGLSITELEMNTLIEATCNSFKKSLNN